MLVAPVLPVQSAARRHAATPPEPAAPAAEVLAAHRRRMGRIVAEAGTRREAAEAAAGNPAPVPPAPPVRQAGAEVRAAEHTASVRLRPVGSELNYWTAADLCKLFGLPRVLIDALAPVAALAGSPLSPGVSPGDPLYDPCRVAEALKAAGHSRLARRLERDPACAELEVAPADVTWDDLDAVWGRVGLGPDAEPLTDDDRDDVRLFDVPRPRRVGAGVTAGRVA